MKNQIYVASDLKHVDEAPIRLVFCNATPFHNKSILLSDLKLSNFRTKVECGGQCLATENCEAFEFIEDKDNKTCR